MGVYRKGAWSVMSHKSQAGYKRVARSQARASCAQPARAQCDSPRRAGASSPGQEWTWSGVPSTQAWGKKEDAPVRQVGSFALALRLPSSFTIREAASSQPPSGAGDGVECTWLPSAQPGPRLRGAVRGTSPRTERRSGRVPGGREGAKDLALSFSGVSLVGRGDTYNLARDQLSYWSGQTSVHAEHT